MITLSTTYEPILSKNTAFNKNFGSSAGTVMEGNDSRSNNGQTAFGWGNHAGLYPTYNGTGATGTWSINISGNSGTVTNGLYNTGSYSDPVWLTSLNYTKVSGLGTAAVANTTDFATAAQGALAASALQSSSSLNPVNIVQTSLYRFVTDAEKTAWNAKLSVEVDGSVINELQTLSLVGQTLSISNGNSITLPTAVGVNSVESTALGTAYNFTSTYQKVTLGTTSPTVTIPTAGTYLILTTTKVDYSGLTTLSVGNVNIKLRRTNNTAADVLPTVSFPLGIVTLLSSVANDVDVRQFLYTTTTSGDIIELWGQVTNTLSLGNIQIAAQGATVTAVRLF